jgi:hypothetical protein
MRICLVAAVLSVVAMVPTNGNAQVYSLPTPAPQITAASAGWQIRGEPVFYAGNFYYPTGPSVFFDGNVMVRTGIYRGVPLYVDATVDPYTIVYVPIGGNVVRPYERPRAGELAGTAGNRAPSFPIERDVDLSVASGRTGLVTPPMEAAVEPGVLPEGERAVAPVATAGSLVPAPSSAGEAAPAERVAPRRTMMESIPRPRTNDGIWFDFAGARYYSAGAAVPFWRDRFALVGDYRGFLVYRDIHGPADEIYVTVVKDGPLAPYKR